MARPRKQGERYPNGRLKEPSKARTRDDACVYVMEARSGLLKIGSSWSPALRAAHLQSEEQLEVAVVWFGRATDAEARAVERAVHKQMQGHRAHVEGEWYQMPSDDAVAVIEAIAASMGVTLETGEAHGHEFKNEEEDGRIRRTNNMINFDRL